jgi:alpha-mannosidase
MTHREYLHRVVLLCSLCLLILCPSCLVSQIVRAEEPIPSNPSSVQHDSETLVRERLLRKCSFTHVRGLRRNEEQVLTAERWAALAWLDGKSYPEAELTEDWKAVLSQSGAPPANSNAARTCKDVQKSYEAVRLSTDKITRSAFQTIVHNIDTRGDGIPVVVFNPLGFLRSGTVSIRAKVPYQEGYHLRLILPHTSGYEYVLRHISWNKRTGVAEMEATVGVVGLGYTIYRLVLERDNVGYPGGSLPDTVQALETSSTIHLRNRYIDVSIDKATGCITSLLRLASTSWRGLRTGVRLADAETIAPGGCGNQILAFHDARNSSPGALGQPLTMLAKADSVKLVGASSPDYAIRVTRTWQSSKLVQTISLNSDSDMVDIETEIDWHEAHVTLKAAFPLAVTSDHATYEIPFGNIEQSTIRENGWGDEVHALRWADLSGMGTDGKVYGLSVINESSNGYDAAGNVLRLTLLGSPVMLDPSADLGRHHFSYALYPHRGTWKDARTVFRGWEYNYSQPSLPPLIQLCYQPRANWWGFTEWTQRKLSS